MFPGHEKTLMLEPMLTGCCVSPAEGTAVEAECSSPNLHKLHRNPASHSSPAPVHVCCTKSCTGYPITARAECRSTVNPSHIYMFAALQCLNVHKLVIKRCLLSRWRLQHTRKWCGTKSKVVGDLRGQIWSHLAAGL